MLLPSRKQRSDPRDSRNKLRPSSSGTAFAGDRERQAVSALGWPRIVGRPAMMAGCKHAALAEAEAKKASTWRHGRGSEDDENFAFAFSSYEEALHEMGGALADDWQNVSSPTLSKGILGSLLK